MNRDYENEIEQTTGKITLDFISRAQERVINYLRIYYQGSTCIVYATKSVTVFESKGELIVLPGSLHDKVDAPFCVEFEMAYSRGRYFVKSMQAY